LIDPIDNGLTYKYIKISMTVRNRKRFLKKDIGSKKEEKYIIS